MTTVAKKKNNDDARPAAGKKYPSRARVKYVAIPIELHQALGDYAAANSSEDDRKSVNWAGRVSIRRFLQAEGFWPRKAPGNIHD